MSADNTQALMSMESAYVRAFRQAEGAPGFQFVQEPGLTRVSSPIPTPWFNSVLHTSLPASEHRSEIERMLSLYGSSGVPLLWRLGPASTERESLSHALQAAGFHRAPPSTAIIGRIPAIINVWELLPVPVSGLRVSSAEEYREWFRIFSASFGVPSEMLPFFAQFAERSGFGPESDTQNLLLLRGDVPVACVTTSWRPQDPFAAIFNFAVAPELRSEGLGKYMLAYAAYRLRRQGAHQIGQFSTQQGAPFYLKVSPARRLGDFENWIWLGSN